ncbi:MAG: YiaA/YiaB family inner membrane protein [Cyanobacteria bacterium P01_H01_bin.21]
MTTTKKITTPTNHTTAWIVQTWLSFVVSISATAIGIFYLPADAWLKGYLGMGLLFSVGSTTSLSKTIRDQEEAKRMLSRIDEAKLERLLAEYDPFKQ